MSSTRSIISPPPFAANALTVIPPTPVAGVSYRDPVAGPASSPDGWPYAERVNSAEWNQIMYQISSLVSIMDKKGVLGWSDLVDYTEAAICLGSDGKPYTWVTASGPNNGGAKDPVSNPAYWSVFSVSGQLVRTTVYQNNAGTLQSSVNGSAFANVSATFTPLAQSLTYEAEGVGAGGGGGVAASSAAGQVSSAPGGGGGGYFKRLGPISEITGQTVSVGLGGISNIATGATAGGSTSIGAVVSATGGSGGSTATTGASTGNPFGITNGGAGSGGQINANGGHGTSGLYTPSPLSGTGGATFYGGGAPPVTGVATTGTNGVAGVTPGAGGSGASNGPSVPVNKPGGIGANGILIIREYR